MNILEERKDVVSLEDLNPAPITLIKSTMLIIKPSLNLLYSFKKLEIKREDNILLPVSTYFRPLLKYFNDL